MSGAVLRRALAALMAITFVSQGPSAQMQQPQQRGGTAQTDKVPPVNTGANPYRAILDWAKFSSEQRPWGGSNGVAIDRDGRSV